MFLKEKEREKDEYLSSVRRTVLHASHVLGTGRLTLLIDELEVFSS